MKDKRIIEGQWWTQGAEQSLHDGVLKFEPEEDMTLSVRIPRPLQASESWVLFNPIGDCPNVIHGLDEHLNPVTLLGCSPGSYSATMGVRKQTIHALAALVGAKVEAWNERRFVAAQLKFSLLQNWVNCHIEETSIDPQDPFAFRLKLPPETVVELVDGTKVRFGVGFGSSHSLGKLSFETEHSIYLHFPETKSAETITNNYTPKIQHLLSLLIGDVVFLDGCTFFENDPYYPRPSESAAGIQLLRCCGGIAEANRDRSGHRMVTQFKEIAADLPTIITRWFELDERLQPVVDLFMLVRARRAPTLEHRFLLLAQAIEAYHARMGNFTATEVSRADSRLRVNALVACVPAEQQEWLREKLAFSNQKTLAARLTDIFTHHETEVRTATEGIPDFAAKVRNTRNYYTHYGEDLMENGSVAQGEELIRITFALEAILGVCLLKELGIKGAPIDRFLQRYTQIKSTQLTTIPAPAAPVTAPQVAEALPAPNSQPTPSI